MDHEQIENLLVIHAEHITQMRDAIDAITEPTLRALLPETDQRIQDLDTRIGFLETGFKEAIHRQHDVTMRPLKTLHDSIDALNSNHVTRIDRLTAKLANLQADVELRHPPTPKEEDTDFPGPNFPH